VEPQALNTSASKATAATSINFVFIVSTPLRYFLTQQGRRAVEKVPGDTCAATLF
jgi:hypothetical protein